MKPTLSFVWFVVAGTVACGGNESGPPEPSAGESSNAGNSGASSGTSGSASSGTSSGGAAGSTPSQAGMSAAASGGSAAASGGSAGDLGAAGQAGVGPTAADDFEAMLKEYPTWQAATAEPVNVSGYIWGLCRLPTPAEEAFAESEHGQQRYIREWDNGLALSVLGAENGSEFPVGAAIAKEKWVVERGSGKETLVGVGMMIRRADGFDSVAGDWQFAYWEDGKGIRYDREQSHYCADCHSSAPDGDFVFRENWQFPHQ